MRWGWPGHWPLAVSGSCWWTPISGRRSFIAGWACRANRDWDKPIDEAIHPAAADVPGCAGLSLVPAGQFEGDPFEMLGSGAMAELVAELKQRFDYTVIDSPPLESSLDATRLASVADGVVLVVRAGKTRSAVVRDAREQLAKAGAKMAGVVLNQYRDYLPRWLRRWL